MIDVRCSVESFEENPYSISSEFHLDEDATSTDAIEMYVKALELDGYRKLSIAHSLYEICEYLCEEEHTTIEKMLEYYKEFEDKLESY